MKQNFNLKIPKNCVTDARERKGRRLLCHSLNNAYTIILNE